MQDLVCTEKYNLIIPTCEFQLLILHLNRSSFPNVTVAIPDYDSLEIALDKYKTLRMCEELDIPTPTSYFDINAEFCNLPNLTYPVILKPVRTTQYSNNRFIHRHVKLVLSKDEARKFIPRLISEGPIILQEFYYGNGMGQEFLADS